MTATFLRNTIQFDTHSNVPTLSKELQMARQRAAAGYPAVYYDLIEGVRDRGQTFTFPCETAKKAQWMRFQLYDFIKACRKSS